MPMPPVLKYCSILYPLLHFQLLYISFSYMFSETVFCSRCGKRFANEASVHNHQRQSSSNCWKAYSLLLQQLSVETNVQSSSTSTYTPPPFEVDMDPPPLMPSFSPEVDMETGDINDQPPRQGAALPALPSFHTEFFQGASKVFGSGETYMDLFSKDKHAAARTTNLYYPFASQAEWELASFLLKSNLSRVAIDQFLKLEFVSVI
jgi:hypothetical protein